MKLSSKEFGPDESIPKKFTCQGEDVSPELTVAEVPEAANALALLMEDPDAPGKTFDHWVAYDIPPETRTFPEGGRPGTQGTNDFGKAGYGGPCPPSGEHRYVFTVFALDERLDLPEGLGKNDLQRVMDGHILDRAELIGLYAKE
jgi:Raf kinase inhibitor-like YbhB/YbcL family protein